MYAGDFDVVTGAFSYSGAAIARELQAAGRRVRTLTGHPDSAGGNAIEVRPLDFADPAGAGRALRGARALYNTYWVRFGHGRVEPRATVAQSPVLFEAAVDAGVGRIVHVSITHPQRGLGGPVFPRQGGGGAGPRSIGLPHAIAAGHLFGGNGVLINNIAWLLRRLPVFAIGGGVNTAIRPVHVDDLARLCVRARDAPRNEIVDAGGPERPAFGGMVGLVKQAVGSRSQVVRCPAR